jgi:pimeloyl-[acyl-carrier protein] methyl ester esterase
MSVFVDVVPGPSPSAPNLTLLHGWGLNGAVWNGVREALSARFNLHIIDLPGHGHSHGAPVTSMDAFADAVVQAMPEHGHLLGWSLGGHTALSIAARYPSRVNRLITVCCTPRFIESEDWPQGKKVEVLAAFASRLGANYNATIRNFLALQALNQPEMRDVIRTLYEAVEAHGAPSVASLAAALDILKVSDLRAAVPSIAQPTLVIQGDHDALTSTGTAQWLADALPNSTHCLIEHAAHAPFLSHRELFLEHVLSFLSQ